MSELFDTHIHLDRLPARTLDKEIGLARAAGIGTYLLPGIAPEGWTQLLNLAQAHPGLLLAPGLHPQAALNWNDTIADELTRLQGEPAVVAVGEIGLDRHSPVPLTIQERAFRGQLRIALASGHPVLLHCRGAFERLMQIFDEEGGEQVGGILHAFSGSREIAVAALRRKLLLGFGGGITWKEARRAPEVLQTLPADAFVFETDAPDLTPHPHRGEPNRPLWLRLVAERAAQLRGCSVDDIARQTTANARRVLRLCD